MVSVTAGPEIVHVMPNFGREHNASSGCWCSPIRDAKALLEGNTVWVHNPEN